MKKKDKCHAKYFSGLYTRPPFSSQHEFVADIFSASGSTFTWPYTASASDGYGKKLYQGDPISDPLKHSFAGGIIDEQRLKKHFLDNLDEEKFEWYQGNFDFPADIEDDFECFCLALAKQFSLIIKKAPAEADDIVFSEYKKLLESPTRAVAISRTLTQSADFDGVFTEVLHSSTIYIPNGCEVRLFHVNPLNMKFEFGLMESFLIKNIVGYVHDRITISKCVQPSDFTTLGLKVRAAFDKAATQDPIWINRELGNILIYAFLEQVLGAPKIYNKIELIEKGNLSEAVAGGGVHLYTNEAGTAPIHRLIFGKSDITANIQAAIDNAISDAKEIIDDNYIKKEMRLIENTVLATSFPAAKAEEIANLLTPKKPGLASAQKSFGIFLGYSLSLGGIADADLRIKISEKMQADLITQAPYIEAQLKSNGLDGYPFYFYFLPFNDADTEKNSILKNIIGGGA